MTVQEIRTAQMQEAKDRKIKENFPTLRDQFAMAALTGLIVDATRNVSADWYASTAYSIADAMMNERKKVNGIN